MAQLPKEITNEKQAGIWTKELEKHEKDELIGIMTRLIAAHPETAAWIQEVSLQKSHKTVSDEGKAQRKMNLAIQGLWERWKVVQEWTDKAARNYGLDYEEEDEAYSDGWSFEKELAQHPELPWEEKTKFLKAITEVAAYDTDYFDWGDILVSAAESLITTPDEYERLLFLVNDGDLEGDFIESLCDTMEEKFDEDLEDDY